MLVGFYIGLRLCPAVITMYLRFVTSCNDGWAKNNSFIFSPTWKALCDNTLVLQAGAPGGYRPEFGGGGGGGGFGRGGGGGGDQ